MKKLFDFTFSKLRWLILFVMILTGCSTIDQMINPDEKSTPRTWPSYQQVMKTKYKGPRARVVLPRFVDKSGKGRGETSQIGDGISDLLCNALLPTNRYIIQIRKSTDDLLKGTDNGNVDLIVQIEVREFKPSIVGAGDEKDEAASVTLLVTLIDPKTKQILVTEKIRGRAIDFKGKAGKVGGALPAGLSSYSKTLTEKAILLSVEDSASFIVAKTPPEYYRVAPKPPPKEVSKSRTSPKPAPLPVLRSTKVVWDSANLREGPGTGYKVMGNVTKGTHLKIIGSDDEWLHIRLNDGSTAWVNKSATAEAPKSHPPASPPAAPSGPTPM